MSLDKIHAAANRPACSTPCREHVSAPVRYCHVCKGNGRKVQAGLNAAGTAHNRRARVGGGTTATVQRDGKTTDNAGTMTNVCDACADALDVLRAQVSGQGTAARNDAETMLHDATAREGAAAQVTDLRTAQVTGWNVLTPEHIALINRTAQRGNGTAWVRSTVQTDALYDAIVDNVVDQCAARAFQVSERDVTRMVQGACYAASSKGNGEDRDAVASLDAIVTNDEGKETALEFTAAVQAAPMVDSDGYSFHVPGARAAGGVRAAVLAVLADPTATDGQRAAALRFLGIPAGLQ